MVGHPPDPRKNNHPEPLNQVLPQFGLDGHEALVGKPAVIISTHNGSASNIRHAPDRHIALIDVAEELKCQDTRAAHRKIFSYIERLTQVFKLAAQQRTELVDVVLKIESFLWTESIVAVVPEEYEPKTGSKTTVAAGHILCVENTGVAVGFRIIFKRKNILRFIRRPQIKLPVNFSQQLGKQVVLRDSVRFPILVSGIISQAPKTIGKTTGRSVKPENE